MICAVNCINLVQNVMDLLDVKTGLCNETHLISSHDGNEVVGIKIENTLCTDEEEEEEENGHMLKSFPSIKSEHGNCMDFVKVAPSSQSNTWLTSDCGCQFNDIKAEYITDIQQQEDPLLIAYPVIKSEREMQNMSSVPTGMQLCWKILVAN